MSALISAVYADRVEVMADTAVISVETGEMQAIYPKAHVVPGRPLVVAGLSDDARTFAVLVVDLMQLLAKSSDAIGDLKALIADKAFRRRHVVPNVVLIAGHFGDCGLGQYAFATGSGLGVEPFVLTEHQGVFTAGQCDDAELVSAGADLDKLASGMDTHGIRFLSAFRNKQAPNGLYTVGGQVQLATLRSDGVTVRAVGYWPDLLGRPIVPGRQFVWAPPEVKPVRAGMVA